MSSHIYTENDGKTFSISVKWKLFRFIVDFIGHLKHYKYLMVDLSIITDMEYVITNSIKWYCNHKIHSIANNNNQKEQEKNRKKIHSFRKSKFYLFYRQSNSFHFFFFLPLLQYYQQRPFQFYRLKRFVFGFVVGNCGGWYPKDIFSLVNYTSIGLQKLYVIVLRIIQQVNTIHRGDNKNSLDMPS